MTTSNRGASAQGQAPSATPAKTRPARPKKASSATHELAEMRQNPEAVARIFREGVYPYKDKMRRKAYEQHKGTSINPLPPSSV